MPSKLKALDHATKPGAPRTRRNLEKTIMLPKLIRRFWRLLPIRRKTQALILLLLAFLSSLSEMLSLGSLVPFVSLFINTELTQSYWSRLTKALPILNPFDPFFVFSLTFIVAVVGSNSLRALFAWASARVTYNMVRDFSIRLYSTALRQEYIEHTRKNTSEVMDQILFKITNAVSNTVLPTFTAMGQSLLAAGIIGALMWYKPMLTVVLAGFVGCTYLLLYLVTHKKVTQGGMEFNALAKAKAKVLSESLGGIRDIIIDQNHALFEKEFAKCETKLRQIEGQLMAYATTPRYIIESVGMLALIIYALAGIKGYLGAQMAGQTILIQLGVLAMGAQRLLPIGQQLYYAITQLKGKTEQLRELIKIIEQSHAIPQEQTPAHKPLSKESTSINAEESPKTSSEHLVLVTLKNVSFRYHNQAPWVLKHYHLVIRSGQKLAICGPTGAGKSTLIDLVMGLLDPTQGEILIQGESLQRHPELRRAWFARLSHVPQSIFLLDDTIENNILFGRPQAPDHSERMKQVCSVAMLDEMLERLPQGLKTFVGERGIRLSGGQRQRIGIARALYKKADVIVLDEATSNLDEATEAELLHRLFDWAKGATIIFVTHRPSVLKYCDEVIELKKEGETVRMGNSALLPDR